MSVQAIVWVLEDCPDLPPHLVAPLLGLANHADENGRGAYPSTDLIAWYTRKGRDAARADFDKLVDLGLIRPGDQRRVLHIPPDRRPVVYDLAMELRRDPRPERPKRGRPRKEQVTTLAVNGGVSTPPRLFDEKTGGSVDENGGVYSRKRGGLQTPLTVLEPPLNQTPANAPIEPCRPRTPRPRNGGGDRDQQPPLVDDLGETETTTSAIARTAHQIYETRHWPRTSTIRAVEQAMANGHTWPEVELVLHRVAAEPDSRGPGRLNAIGLPAAYWDDARDQLRPTAPPWCGECNPYGRRLIDPDTYADLGQCPRCHYALVRPTQS